MNCCELVSLGVLGALVLTTGCAPEPPPASSVVRPVKTMVVASGSEPHVRLFPGVVEASRRVELAFQVSGLLVKFPVREGQAVAKDEVIGELRQDEFKARLESLQGQLDQARASLAALRAGERPEERLRRESQVRAANARLADARAQLDRGRQLVQGRNISRAEFETLETNYQVATEDLKAAVQLSEAGTIGREEDILASEAQVRSLEAQVVVANIQLNDTTLRVPYDGVIAQRFVEEGQNVTAKQPVVRLQDVEEIEIVADVPETVMAMEIQSADIIELLAELSGAPGLQFPVQIREVAQVADPTTQTFKVRAAMQVPEGIRVLPGMSATVMVTYRRASILGDQILVPISSIFNDASGEQVAWVIDPNQTVSRRPVKIGAATGGQIEIVEGLQPGDRIATAGTTHLREGMKVSDLGDALGGSPQ